MFQLGHVEPIPRRFICEAVQIISVVRMVVTKEETEDTVKFLIEIHNDILSATSNSLPITFLEFNKELPTGGEPGVRDSAGLYMLAYKILSFKERLPRPIEELAAELLYDVARNHYFWDGNKRTAYVMAKLFMFPLLKPDYKNAVEFIIKVADKKANKAQIRKWLIDNSGREAK